MALSRETEVEIGEGDAMIVAMIECHIDPGFKGSGSMYTAASDIDYYGQPPSVDGIESVMVSDAETGSPRKPTEAEQATIDAWLESKAGQSWQDDQAIEWAENQRDDYDGEP